MQPRALASTCLRASALTLAILAGVSTVASMALPSASAAPGAAGAATAVAAGGPVPFGGAYLLGSMAGHKINSPIVAMATDPVGKGYWLVAADGGIFSYGSAHFYGSAGAIHLKSPIVGMAAFPNGKGYWLVAADGGIFSYGAAQFHGSTGALHLNAPIVGMAVDPDGDGYWLVAADGGIFSYGSAHFYGSTGALHLKSPIVGMAAAPTGKGYWLAAAAGGVFAYGDAPFCGSLGATTHSASVTTIAPAWHGDGYLLATANGDVYPYGTATFKGALSSVALASQADEVTGISTTANGGYWLLPTAIPPTPVPPNKPLPPPGPTVSEGDSGAAVLAVQQRLTALGYWLGTPDGNFGDSTEQAVWALQKAAGLTRDGVVGPTTYDALYKGIVPKPLSTSGYVVEIDLNDDLIMFVNNGKLLHILNTSTGGGYTYSDGGGTFTALTPTGHFQIYAAIDGLATDSLGQLWRPRFFYEGFAIHGDGYVPPVPVSHGCSRVSDEAINWIWANNLLPIGTDVWVYGNNP